MNLTLEVPVAEHVEKISREANYRPSGAGRVMLEQRLALEAAGWKIDNNELFTLLEAVCRLKPENLESIKITMRGLVAKEASDEALRAGSAH
ncbi:MAG: hypothetical protein DIKNOCCD_01563 [bacterium]|nr:MAG: hypothetical protein UZ16_OP3001001003 [Candidatus Hinthialibacteria bacterium OLB16]MBV6481834.1 hypothetical protein [bacterium]